MTTGRMRSIGQRHRTGRVSHGTLNEPVVAGNRQAASAAARAGGLYTAPATGTNGLGTHRPPPLGSRERDILAAHIRDLKAAGFAHLDVALALRITEHTVVTLCREYSIPSVRKAQGGHRRTG